MQAGRRVYVVTFLLVGCCAACSDSASPTQPSGVTAPAESFQDEPSGVSSPAQAFQDGASELAGVRRATAAFHDIEQAVAAGYATPVAGHCEATAAGAMGVHSPNATLVRDPAVDALAPEILLYLPNGHDGYRLVGVEYFQTVLVRNTLTGTVGPWRSPDPWPSNYVVVNAPPSLFGQTFQGPMAGHSPTMPWHYDLHVWAWAANPAGTFAQWNPALTCE